MKTAAQVWVVGFVSAGCFTVAAAQQAPFLQLAIEAIDSSGGRAQQTFPRSEPWVMAMRQKMETQGPITVSTQVVNRFKEDGCARLQTRFVIHEAKLTNGKLEDVVFALNYNTCRDGQPPMESLDIRDIAGFVQGDEGVSKRGIMLPPVVPLDKPNERPPTDRSTNSTVTKKKPQSAEAAAPK